MLYTQYVTRAYIQTHTYIHIHMYMHISIIKEETMNLREYWGSWRKERERWEWCKCSVMYEVLKNYIKTSWIKKSIRMKSSTYDQNTTKQQPTKPFLPLPCSGKLTVELVIKYQWLNEACLCNEVSIETQNDRFQGASRQMNTASWRSEFLGGEYI